MFSASSSESKDVGCWPLWTQTTDSLCIHFGLLHSLILSRNRAGLHWPVVSVLDGDTIEVLHNTHPERIRLSGMDWSRATLTFIGVSVAPEVTVLILFAFSNRRLRSII